MSSFKFFLHIIKLLKLLPREFFWFLDRNYQAYKHIQFWKGWVQYIMKACSLLLLKLIMCKTSILEIILDLQNMALGIPQDREGILENMEQTEHWRGSCNDYSISGENFISITHPEKNTSKGQNLQQSYHQKDSSSNAKPDDACSTSASFSIEDNRKMEKRTHNQSPKGQLSGGEIKVGNTEWKTCVLQCILDSLHNTWDCE